MVKIIDMQDIRHLNLFGKITQVQTRFCFKYNNTLIFCVPYPLLHKAVGENGKNVQKMKEVLRKKIRIVAKPRGIQDAKNFIESIVNPIKIKETNINGDEIIINTMRQNKASLIGRDKRRLKEMQVIVKDFFGKDVRII
ncbi:hypothetical protein CMI44_00475 [Candidatus Pacearchaeota archaeon]|nr:hypothetical protein [Candidatus Pacearchaeota archaeon]|tara:strand:+ start:397 stop:813 length:417 start_codon:yes stop_codon:yes gene_type:complete